MSKPALGLVLGGVLGLLDGASALAYPEARPMIAAIVIGSTIKGVLTGLVAGWIATRWRSVPVGIAAGTIIGFVLSLLAALPPGPDGQHHYAEIILPGMLVGAIVGFVTQQYPRTAVLAAVLGVLVSSTAGAGQSPATEDPLAPLAPLIGRWEGTSSGQPGTGRSDREYTRVLGGRYVHARNHATYPPQEKNPKGEVHEDLGVFSFDRGRKRIVLRQFHVEGFVNQYVSEEGAGGTLVFTTEAIENIPPGWRARETYRQLGPDEIEEVFELAEPGKPFEVYSRTRLKRVR